jgi:hypothetical protein
MLHNPNSSIVDGQMTKVLDGNLLKVLSWYDNEWGYSCRVVDLIAMISTERASSTSHRLAITFCAPACMNAHAKPISPSPE